LNNENDFSRAASGARTERRENIENEPEFLFYSMPWIIQLAQDDEQETAVPELRETLDGAPSSPGKENGHETT
jgi:hypothetical protein